VNPAIAAESRWPVKVVVEVKGMKLGEGGVILILLLCGVRAL